MVFARAVGRNIWKWCRTSETEETSSRHRCILRLVGWDCNWLLQTRGDAQREPGKWLTKVVSASWLDSPLATDAHSVINGMPLFIRLDPMRSIVHNAGASGRSPSGVIKTSPVFCNSIHSSITLLIVWQFKWLAPFSQLQLYSRTRKLFQIESFLWLIPFGLRWVHHNIQKLLWSAPK